MQNYYVNRPATRLDTCTNHASLQTGFVLVFAAKCSHAFAIKLPFNELINREMRVKGLFICKMCRGIFNTPCVTGNNAVKMYAFMCTNGFVRIEINTHVSLWKMNFAAASCKLGNFKSFFFFLKKKNKHKNKTSLVDVDEAKKSTTSFD